MYVSHDCATFFEKGPNQCSIASILAKVFVQKARTKFNEREFKCIVFEPAFLSWIAFASDFWAPFSLSVSIRRNSISSCIVSFCFFNRSIAFRSFTSATTCPCSRYCKFVSSSSFSICPSRSRSWYSKSNSRCKCRTRFFISSTDTESRRRQSRAAISYSTVSVSAKLTRLPRFGRRCRCRCSSRRCCCCGCCTVVSCGLLVDTPTEHTGKADEPRSGANMMKSSKIISLSWKYIRTQLVALENGSGGQKIPIRDFVAFEGKAQRSSTTNGMPACDAGPTGTRAEVIPNILAKGHSKLQYYVCSTSYEGIIRICPLNESYKLEFPFFWEPNATWQWLGW